MIITFANCMSGIGKTALALVTAETLISSNIAIDIFDFDQLHNLMQKLKLNSNCATFLKDKSFDKVRGKRELFSY